MASEWKAGDKVPGAVESRGEVAKEQGIHWGRTIQTAFWVLDSPEVLRRRDIRSLGVTSVTSDSQSSVLKSENGTTLCTAFPLGIPGFFPFPFLLSLSLPSSFPKGSVPMLLFYSVLSFIFFFPSLDLPTLLSGCASGPGCQKSHCEPEMETSILLRGSMA